MANIVPPKIDTINNIFVGLGLHIVIAAIIIIANIDE